MAQVFLSYARDDVGRAKALAVAIERTGSSVWWDRDLEGGAEYSLEIDDALKAAQVVVVLWSKASVGSAWVRDEAAAGRDSGRLVPVRLDASEPPLGFRQYQTIDLARWNGRSDSAGVKTLKRAIAAKVVRGSSPAAPAPSIEVTRQSLPKWAVPLAAALLLMAAVLGYVWYSNSATSRVPTIAIVSAPSGGERTSSEQLARSLAVEIGTLQSGAGNSFELRETNGSQAPDVDYLVQVASAKTAQSTAADVSIVAQGDRSILWTGHFEKPSATETELRLQATTRLAAVLGCLMEASSALGRQLDIATLKLYLRGCEKSGDEYGEMPDPSRLRMFQQVVERYPRFAPALAHLALLEVNASADETEVGRSARASHLEQAAKRHLAEARRLNPTLGKTYLAERNLLPRPQWRQRQQILERGLEMSPDDAELHIALGFDLAQVGRLNEAVALDRRALELNPLSPAIRASLVQALSNSGRIVEAEKELQKAEKIWPASKLLATARFAFDLRFGDPSEALRLIRESSDYGTSVGSSVATPNPGVEAFVQARIDPTPVNIDKAIAAYSGRLRQDPEDRGSMIMSLAGLGRTDLAYEILAHPSVTKTMPHGTEILFRPFMRSIRYETRFMPLAASVGLVRYWTETSKWPDFCFEPDLPYDCKAEAAKLKAAGKVR